MSGYEPQVKMVGIHHSVSIEQYRRLGRDAIIELLQRQVNEDIGRMGYQPVGEQWSVCEWARRFATDADEPDVAVVHTDGPEDPETQEVVISVDRLVRWSPRS